MTSFLEDKLDYEPVARERNRYVVSLIPYEETTTYGKGTVHGPEAIVDASGHIELFDEVLFTDASTQGVITLRPEISDLASVTRAARHTADTNPDALLGFLGGEHSVTPAIIEGVHRENMGIVWLDAHADLRPEFHGRADNHACAGHHSLAFGPMAQIGIRTLAEEEYAFLKTTDHVTQHRTWGEAAREAILALPDNIYLTVDMDGFTPELVRGVGTPEPGGLSWDDAMEILDVLFTNKNVFAYDVVELCPSEHDLTSSFVAARLVYKIMNYHAFHKLGG